MNNIAQEICDCITMQDICDMYGYELNRAKFMVCPFHGEKTPSLKVYPDNRGWYCFGCGRGGSVIDFVEEAFDLNFSQAIVRLNTDFGLHITYEHPNKELLNEIQNNRIKRQIQKEESQKEFNALACRHRELLKILKEKAPKNEEDEMSLEYCLALKEQPYIEYLLDTFKWEG